MLQIVGKLYKKFGYFSPFEPTDQYDLYKAFDRAVREDGTLNEYLNFNFTHYYDVWVNQPGYPILNVSIDHATGEMSLSQVS